MKKLLCFVFAFCSFYVIPGLMQAQERITLSSMEGLSSEIGIKIIKEAYQHIGIHVDVKVVPSERALYMANKGQVDGLATRIWAIGEKYPNLVRVSVPVKTLKGCVFTKDTIFDVKGWESLKPYKIGILTGSKFAQIGTKGMNVEQVSTYKQMFKKLVHGRSDIVVAEQSNAMGCLYKMKLTDEIKQLEPPLIETDLYHYVHRKNEKLVPKFAKALQKLKANGRDLEIYNETMAELSK